MPRLPGDPSEKDLIARAIRVDHAGEYGAKRIYEGQLSATNDPKARAEIKHMAEQEQVHLDYFDDQITIRHVRPTLLQPLWHFSGFMLGKCTALLGTHAAMACTEAVETVIDEHYQTQLRFLPESEASLKEHIERFRQEELEHKETAQHEGAHLAPAYAPLTAAIQATSRIAVWIAERF